MGYYKVLSTPLPYAKEGYKGLHRAEPGYCSLHLRKMGKISNIEAENVDLKSGLVRIMGKGGKERYIQIREPAILKLLNRYYDANKEEIKQSGYFLLIPVGNVTLSNL